MGRAGKVKFIRYVEFPLHRYVAQHFLHILYKIYLSLTHKG